MAQFNPADYETVEERLKRFWADPANADARLVTLNHTTAADRNTGVWVVEARLFLNASDQQNNLPKTTGWAYEVDGGGGANRTSALENAETSSLGRCLANYLYSGNKRSSREEMAKVERGITPKRDWLKDAEALGLAYNVDGLLALYQDAVAARVPADVLAQIKDYGSAARG
jgi:hypothetical protein